MLIGADDNRQPPSTRRRRSHRPRQQPGQQPDVIDDSIAGAGGAAKIAVPDFIALSNDPETVQAAKIDRRGAVGRHLNFEQEFYMIPRDIMTNDPAAGLGRPGRTRSVEGAWGRRRGHRHVRRSGDGVVVEVRLLQVASGQWRSGSSTAAR